MVKTSAGILVYRYVASALEVFLVHPGGPFWSKQDLGSWSIPKGEVGSDEDALTAARREFREETGFEIDGAFIALKPIKQRRTKLVQAWAVEGDFDPVTLKSNLFSIEWPPNSGRVQQFPEVDRGAWFSMREARSKILKGQRPLLTELGRILASSRN